jgi:hypothetical protein
MLMLGLIFQSLSVRKPDLNAGVVRLAAKASASTSASSALGYWAAACLGNVSFLVLYKSTPAVIPAGSAGSSNTGRGVDDVHPALVHPLPAPPWRATGGDPRKRRHDGCRG